MPVTAAELVSSLGLVPHPEGGFFRETYRSPHVVATPRGERAAATAIVFLVTAGSCSRLHRLSSDELWIYQGGLPLEVVTITADGVLEHRLLGLQPAASPGLAQALVPAGSWQGARLAGAQGLPAELAWCLVSCVVTPGFDFADFELAERDALRACYPRHAALIRALT